MAVSRIFDLLDNYDHYQDVKIAFADKRDNNWISLSPMEYKQESMYFAYGLLASGVKKGDKIATVINNCSEWNIIDMGISMCGAVHVPIYPSFSEKEFEYVLNHSESNILFVSDYQIFRIFKNVVKNVKSIKNIYSLDNGKGTISWKEIISKGKIAEKEYKDSLETIMTNIQPDDLATIIYTSGTTGLSKGVMLSHDNIMSNVLTVSSRQHLRSGARILSFLPLCHIYERMVNYQYQYLGISIYYGENMNMISENLKELKVDGITAVPRVFEKMYEKIMVKGEELPGLSKKIFFRAITHAFKFKLNNNSLGYRIMLKFYDLLVYSRWRQELGGNIRCAGVGGASCRVGLLRLFWAAKIPLYEGYGLTETSPIISVNYGIPESRNLYKTLKIGSTGKILENVFVKISEDGEILCKGPGVMKAYYKDMEKTKEVFTEEGWFRTGDIGTIDDDNFLTITGRKKDLFKTSWGKYVAPQHMEDIFRQSMFIDQILVIGENKKFPSAIISPDIRHLKQWSKKQNIETNDIGEIINIGRVIARYRKEISIINKNFGKPERIKGFRLVTDKWSTETGELSPTQKLRRNFILSKYENIVREIYGESVKG